MNGANINYQTTHSISIADFPNNAPMVNPSLSNNLSEAVRDLFSRQTRLQILRLHHRLRSDAGRHLRGQLCIGEQTDHPRAGTLYQ